MSRNPAWSETGGLALVTGTSHLENVIDRGVLLVAEPCQRFNFIQVDQAVTEDCIVDMDAEHLAENSAVDAILECAGQLNFLEKLTFKVNRCLGHTRWLDQRRGLGGQTGQFEFADAVIQWRGGRIHRILKGQRHHVDHELATCLDVVQRVFLAAVLVIAGEGDHHDRWIAGQGVEKTEGCQVDRTIGVNRRHPGDRSRHDAALEWVVG